LAGKGKRGGARVIYYYHSERLPVFLPGSLREERKSELEQGGMQWHAASGSDPGVCGGGRAA
jgi:hypothetical protein